jgi:hypothetical protein
MVRDARTTADATVDATPFYWATHRRRGRAKSLSGPVVSWDMIDSRHVVVDAGGMDPYRSHFF